MDKVKLSMKLPKVGEHLERVITIGRFDPGNPYAVEPCVVTYTDAKKGWYEVEFVNTKLRECYNLPAFDHSILKNVSPFETPIVCIETGYVYPSVSKCAKDMGLDDGNISRQISGVYPHVCGYHFDTVM